MSDTKLGKVKHIILYVLDYCMIGLSIIIPLLKYYNVQFAFMPELSIITGVLLVLLLLLRSVMHYLLNEKHKRAKMEMALLKQEKTYSDIENNELKSYLESFRLPIEQVISRAREIYKNTPKNEPDTGNEPTTMITPHDESPKSDTTNYEQPVNFSSFILKIKSIVNK